MKEIINSKIRNKDTRHYITNKVKREVTLCKRKRGLIKKVIELSQLCNIDIFMTLFDKEKQKIIEFRSQNNFTSSVVSDLLQREIRP